MEDFKKHFIRNNTVVIDAISQIDELSNRGEPLTLFVCNLQNKLVGTLTDGDIRRGFVKGLSLQSPVDDFMAKKFSFVNSHTHDVMEIHNFRKQGIQSLPCLSADGEIIRVYDLQRYKSILPMECMIMAGGKGERLRPLTNKTPKPLLKLDNKPIIEYNIDRLIDYGIQKIYISINYLGDQIKKYLGDGSKKGISIEYIEEEKPLGTGGALSLVKSYATDYVLLMNSDLFTDIDFEDLFLSTLNQQAEIGIASIPYSVNIPYAIFQKDQDKILSFSEKPTNTHYANAGIYVIKKKWIDLIPYNEFFNITDLIQLLLDKGEKIIDNPIVGYWIDIGQHEDYKKAQEIIKHIR